MTCNEDSTTSSHNKRKSAALPATSSIPYDCMMSTLSHDKKKIKLEMDMKTESGPDADGATAPIETAPCLPGTPIMLEGIVWNETDRGLLVLNVTWKGKTFVGALFDSTKKGWAPPRFAEPIKKPVDNTAEHLLLNIDPSVRLLRNGKKRYVEKLNNNNNSNQKSSRASTKKGKKQPNTRYYRTNSCSSSELSTVSDQQKPNAILPTSPASSISSQYSNSRSS